MMILRKSLRESHGNIAISKTEIGSKEPAFILWARTLCQSRLIRRISGCLAHIYKN